MADTEKPPTFTAEAMFLRGIVSAAGTDRIKLLANFPADDFNRPWESLAPELQDKWRSIAQLAFQGMKRLVYDEALKEASTSIRKSIDELFSKEKS